MPFNGTGMFVRVRNWVDDALAGIRIRADFHDIEDDGFAAGLSQCITRDGQSTVLNNIPFNSKRIVSLQDPADPQDGATKAYADLMLPLDGRHHHRQSRRHRINRSGCRIQDASRRVGAAGREHIQLRLDRQRHGLLG